MLRLAVFLSSALFAHAGIGGVDIPGVDVGGCTLPEVKCLATDACVSATEAAGSACTNVDVGGNIPDMEVVCPSTGESVTLAQLESPTIYEECFPGGVIPSSVSDALGSYTGMLGAGATGPNGCVVTAGEAWCPGLSMCISAGEVASNPDACLEVDLSTITAIGGDRDPTFGCYTAAGYIWCPTLEKCVQPWVDTCADLENLPDTPSFADSTGIHGEILGGGEDAHGCLIAGGQQYCPSTQKCVQPWSGECTDFDVDLEGLSGAATAIIGGQQDDHGCYTGAGFTWCASTQRCHQPFDTDTPCTLVEAAAPTDTPSDTPSDTPTAATGTTGTTGTNTNTTDTPEDGAASSQQPLFIIIATLCALSMF